MAIAILLLLASVALAEQSVFSSDESKTGLVRRYQVNTSQTAELVIGAAQVHQFTITFLILAKDHRRIITSIYGM